MSYIGETLLCHTVLYRQGKVNLSLLLTKYYAMKLYPVLNQAPHYEDVLGSGGIFSRILILGARWR